MVQESDIRDEFVKQQNTITDYDKNIILDCLYDYQKWFDEDESQYQSIEEVINRLLI